MTAAITFKKWYERGSYLVHRGHPIFYHTGGTSDSAAENSGPVLLLIHGFPTSSWEWHHLWPSLCSRFGRVIALDMIGFGYSAKPRDCAYSILDQADLQEALLRELGVVDYHILAHDYGVTVTQELLARQLDRASHPANREPHPLSACLLNAGIFPEVHKPTLLQKLLRTRLGPWISQLMTEERFRRAFLRVFGPATRPSFDEVYEFWQQIVYNGGDAIAYKLIRYLDERFEYRERWVGALQQTSLPLRLINGPVDPVSGGHMAKAYRELIPNPDVVPLTGIGHYPQIEAPEATLGAFLEFFERATGKA